MTREEVTEEIESFGAMDYTLITSPGGVRWENGVEIPDQGEESTTIRGWIRVPTSREVDAGLLRTDLIGCFTGDVVIENGMVIVVDAVRYVVIAANPLKHTDVTLCYQPVLRS